MVGLHAETQSLRKTHDEEAEHDQCREHFEQRESGSLFSLRTSPQRPVPCGGPNPRRCVSSRTSRLRPSDRQPTVVVTR